MIGAFKKSGREGGWGAKESLAAKFRGTETRSGLLLWSLIPDYCGGGM